MGGAIGADLIRTAGERDGIRKDREAEGRISLNFKKGTKQTESGERRKRDWKGRGTEEGRISLNFNLCLVR
jgi:hypothetical protein